MSEMTGTCGWPANRFEELYDVMSNGGIETYVRLNKLEDTPVFEFQKGAVPTFAAVAAASEVARLFASDAAFKDAMISHCVFMGATLHYTGEAAWTYRELTPAESAALRAEEAVFTA